MVPVGDGCIIGGVHKGLKDLQASGMVEATCRASSACKRPGLITCGRPGVATRTYWTKPAIAADTVADSISAGLPRDRIKAMAAVRETGGVYIRVER